MEFKLLSTAIGKKFHSMSSTGLFRVDIEKDLLWDTYLASFPAGSNPIYRERTEHDCQCCKSFVRTLGGVVAISGGAVTSIWDVQVGDPAYQVVVDAMAQLVAGRPITNAFLHPDGVVGVSSSRQLLADQTVKSWDHFFVNLPPAVTCKGVDIGPHLSESRSTHDVMLRGLTEITAEAIGTVQELIAQNSLYRGEEQQFAVEAWRKLKAQFDAVPPGPGRDLFVWGNMHSVPQSVSRIRNTSIGTLLTDLSEGKELDESVKSFEAKVAPANYKRPTALVTKAMIQRAQEAINELGFASALERRYAVLEDITVNNILFADRAARKAMNVFDQIAASVPATDKSFDKVEEVGIEDFISKILPRAEQIEVFFENRHSGNLASLIAPCDPTAKSMFKWENNFSWSYAGDLTDSIKERVKRAGGQIEADLRCSLSWFNYDDLDLHLAEPHGNEIFYGNKLSLSSGGKLDVDMNAGSGNTRSAVDNIFFPDRGRMKEGRYKLRVHNFCFRESQDVGFDAEMEFDGKIHSFSYAKPVRNAEFVTVAEFTYSHKKGFEITQSLPSTQSSKTVWGLPTQNFHRANVVMLSPNQWDARAVGNKHYFFMLDGCRNEGKARGLYNEFLNEALAQHRKVLEVVGAKMKTEESDRQLSGLGFSSTQRNSVMCRVKGSFSRTVKVVF